MSAMLSVTQMLFTGYQVTMLVLLVYRLFPGRPSATWQTLIRYSNALLLVISLCYGLAYLSELAGAYNHSDAAMDTYRWRVRGPYWYAYWAMVILPFLAPQIFWIRKCRNSWKASLCVLPILSAGAFMERIVIYLTVTYRDYLPSSWTYYAPGPLELLLPAVLFAVLLTAVFLIFRKRKIAA